MNGGADLVVFWVFGIGGVFAGTILNQPIVGTALIAVAIGWVLYRLATEPRPRGRKTRAKE